MIFYDKTFAAANIIFKTQQIADYREATINHFNDKYETLKDRLKETHENFYINTKTFFGDQEVLKIPNKKAGQEEMAGSLSFENLETFINNMAFGEYRYFTSDNIYTSYSEVTGDPDSQVYDPKVQSIVNKAINNQYNLYGTGAEQAIGPEISYLDLDTNIKVGKKDYGDRVYYVTVHQKIKQDGEIKVVHYVQPVAAEKAVYKGRDIYRLVYP